ncbi:MAG TPA: TetR/AcrR family transcriptional regulator [Lacunisphaera sp.]
MKKKPARAYESPLRRAQADATRDRILAALADLVAEGGEGNVNFDVLAKRSGIERRTVFRHFPNREELLHAFWLWINQRVTPQTLPERFNDFLTLPAVTFAGFDENHGIISASLHSPWGRQMRLAALPLRREKFRQAISEGLGDVAAAERRSLEVIAHLLYSASAWETLRDYCGMNGREAGETVAWAMKTLREALSSSGRKPRPTDK